MKVSFAETRAPVAPPSLVSEPSQGWTGWTSAARRSPLFPGFASIREAALRVQRGEQAALE